MHSAYTDLGEIQSGYGVALAVNLQSAVQRRRHLAEARRRGALMDFQMKLKFMRQTTEENPFTNWVKPDVYRTFDITLKNLRVSAPPREISARHEESALW